MAEEKDQGLLFDTAVYETDPPRLWLPEKVKEIEKALGARLGEFETTSQFLRITLKEGAALYKLGSDHGSIRVPYTTQYEEETENQITLSPYADYYGPVDGFFMGIGVNSHNETMVVITSNITDIDIFMMAVRVDDIENISRFHDNATRALIILQNNLAGVPRGYPETVTLDYDGLESLSDIIYSNLTDPELIYNENA